MYRGIDCASGAVAAGSAAPAATFFIGGCLPRLGVDARDELADVDALVSVAEPCDIFPVVIPNSDGRMSTNSTSDKSDSVDATDSAIIYSELLSLLRRRLGVFRGVGLQLTRASAVGAFTRGRQGKVGASYSSRLALIQSERL